jgi:SAM-dependent methyltransferase
MWKRGEEQARLLSDFLKQRGLKRCKILDIPCGIGRVSMPLAKLGYSVVGVDLSPYFVALTKKKARQFSVARRASFSIGRMRDVGSMFPVGTFDVAINIFTSIGYGSDEDDLAFFRGLRRVVRKGGLFVIGALRTGTTSSRTSSKTCTTNQTRYWSSIGTSWTCSIPR